SLIGTVRNVGYRFVVPEKVERAAAEEAAKAEKQAGDAEHRTGNRAGADGRARTGAGTRAGRPEPASQAKR
ncbi:hypothetical protein ADK38_32065, partial [Streptomyces varsoviensis]